MNSTIKDIRKPIEREFEAYIKLFNETLTHTDELQNTVFEQIKSRGGKRLRPTLLLLIAKAFSGSFEEKTEKISNIGEDLRKENNNSSNINEGFEGENKALNQDKTKREECFCGVSEDALRAAVAIELLHTASLVHDDVVDDSDERRGEASVNSKNGNKIAVLLGDYILSTALLSVYMTGRSELVSILSRVGQTLADGEILQLKKDTNLDLNYETYYKIIEKKTASLFMACCEAGALCGEKRKIKNDELRINNEKLGIESEEVSKKSKELREKNDDLRKKAVEFGRLLGLIFQIRDDIFDYLPTEELGKPAAKDMKEGKITLPALYILNVSREKNSGVNGQNIGNASSEKLMDLALKVKKGTITDDEISYFITYVVAHGGIEYAEKKMQELAEKAHILADEITENNDIRNCLHTLIDYFAKRNK